MEGPNSVDVAWHGVVGEMTLLDAQEDYA